MINLIFYRMKEVGALLNNQDIGFVQLVNEAQGMTMLQFKGWLKNLPDTELEEAVLAAKNIYTYAKSAQETRKLLQPSC